MPDLLRRRQPTRYARRRGEPWTAEEDELLRTAAPGSSRRELAVCLGRTTEAVAGRMAWLRAKAREQVNA